MGFESRSFPELLSWRGEDLLVKHLLPSDLDEVASIERRSHDFPWSRQHLFGSLTSHLCFGVVRSHKCLGYAVFSVVLDHAELLLFVIDRPLWGQGLGTAFLQRLLDRLGAQVDEVFLEVRESNAKAIGLYESLGFNQIGERPNYYPAFRGGRENALVLGYTCPRE